MTDLKVVELKPKPPKKLEPDDTIVTMLKDALALAQEGKIIGIAFVTMEHDNSICYAKSGYQNFGTIGALDILSQHIVRTHLEGRNKP